MTLLESWSKTGQERHVFAKQFWILKFDPSRTLLELFLVTWKNPLSNSTSEMVHKTVAVRHSHIIFISWHYLTWPWRLLIWRSILKCYHLHPLVLAMFMLADVISIVSVADKANSDDFDLWPFPCPDLWLILRKNKISLKIHTCLLRAFDCHQAASLRLLVR